MNKFLNTLTFIISTVLIICCTKKGEEITEPGFGNYTFTTYTVDTFRFRVVVNDIVLSDSLLSPVSNISKDIFILDDSVAKLKIINAKNNEVYIDTAFHLKTGRSTISIVQLLAGQKPHLPPMPNEPSPAPGKYKLRIQYLQANANTPFFYDSIKCIIRKGGVTIDSVTLKKLELSKFYEFASTTISDFTLRIIHPGTGASIDASMNSIGGSYAGFNTARIYGLSPTNFMLGRIY